MTVYKTLVNVKETTKDELSVTLHFSFYQTGIAKRFTLSKQTSLLK